jgi:hypothetical protein
LDDPPVQTFLRALAELPESLALTKLAGLLRCYPLLAGHPYVWPIFFRLYQFASPYEALNQYAEDWLGQLIKAWVEGMTRGKSVSVTVAPSQHGRPPTLFPKLSEQHGWGPSDAADKDRREAMEFIRIYEDLQERLRKLGAWKERAAEFRVKPDHVVSERAWDVQRVFERFMKERGLEAQALDEADYRKIVQTGFNQVYKRQSVRHEITCQLLAALKWSLSEGKSKKVDSGLIHKTLETLRQHLGKDWQDAIRTIHSYRSRGNKPSPPVSVREIGPNRYAYGPANPAVEKAAPTSAHRRKK